MDDYILFVVWAIGSLSTFGGLAAWSIARRPAAAVLGTLGFVVVATVVGAAGGLVFGLVVGGVASAAIGYALDPRRQRGASTGSPRAGTD